MPFVGCFSGFPAQGGRRRQQRKQIGLGCAFLKAFHRDCEFSRERGVRYRHGRRLRGIGGSLAMLSVTDRNRNIAVILLISALSGPMSIYLNLFDTPCASKDAPCFAAGPQP